MARYRKKPVLIEAERFDGSQESAEHLKAWTNGAIDLCGFTLGGRRVLEIPTLEGIMTAQPGDYIVRGVSGEYYPVKPDIFATTYERCEP